VSATDRWPETRADSDKGGLSVAIVGDDGVRYYGSHLSAVADGIRPGVRVAAGQLLGLTGESGNAAGVYPQLHFGISHPSTPEDWRVRRGEIWPQRYLRAWARGEQLAPALP
jgi:murein DD-endopeptidase MepM/ murein hydrolase activator NlpD